MTDTSPANERHGRHARSERIRRATTLAPVLFAILGSIAFFPACTSLADQPPSDPSRARPDSRAGLTRPPPPRADRNGPLNPPPPQRVLDPLLADLERRAFDWFWDFANPTTGLVPDRAPMNGAFCSIASQGFALTAYTIGAERGYVPRAQIRDRVRANLEFLAALPQGAQATGVGGFHGLFYHFLDLNTGHRLENTVELSTIDTALLMAGVLTAGAYFDGDDPAEAAIRERADFLYRRVEWDWAVVRPPLISMGWYPESGYHAMDWRGYNEAMILYILALGSPTHPVSPAAWDTYTSTYDWATFEGQSYVQFAPLFGHQFTSVWVDLSGIADAYMRGRGIDYAENTRRATLAHRAYAVHNPLRFKGVGENIWGYTACDGPGDFSATVDGIRHTFFGYAARGASIDDTRDDGTIAPYAAVGSLPFMPDVALEALRTMRSRYGNDIYGRYGFVDAFNPTLTLASMPIQHGMIVVGKGWFDTDNVGIDQGPLVGMIANYRDRHTWALMRGNPYVIAGLRAAGFRGGWLDRAP
jgi:hypothetical protein